MAEGKKGHTHPGVCVCILIFLLFFPAFLYCSLAPYFSSLCVSVHQKCGNRVILGNNTLFCRFLNFITLSFSFVACNLLGGDVWVRCRTGEAVSFFFYFPFSVVLVVYLLGVSPPFRCEGGGRKLEGGGGVFSFLLLLLLLCCRILFLHSLSFLWLVGVDRTMCGV